MKTKNTSLHPALKGIFRIDPSTYSPHQNHLNPKHAATVTLQKAYVQQNTKGLKPSQSPSSLKKNDENRRMSNKKTKGET